MKVSNCNDNSVYNNNKVYDNGNSDDKFGDTDLKRRKITLK